MLNKSKTAKFLAGFVAFAFVVTMVATPVSTKAQTSAELQAMINSLLAQIAALQGQVTGGVVSNAFVTDLTIGSTGANVTSLQQWLVSKGFLTMPAGVSFGYFGPLTASAVASYQTSKGISPASGYFGPITRASVNSMMTPGTPPGVTPPGVTPPGVTPPGVTPPGLQGGAGSISDADFISGINSEDVGEDQEDVEVAGLEIEADQGSDLEITAVTLDFDRATAGAGSSDDLEDYASEVSIWFNGEEMARVDADSFDEDNDFSRTISLSSGAVIDADETGDLVVGITGISNLDSDDANEDWNVAFEGIRFEDAQGAIITDTSTGDITIGNDDTVNDTGERVFTFATFASANDVELTVSESSDSPDTMSIEADENDEIVLLIGEFEAEGSDIEIIEVTATTTAAGTGSVSEIASEFILMIDGEEVDSVNSTACVTIANCIASSTGSAVYVFDDVDFTVEEGDTVEFEIVAVLNDISTTFVAGDSLTAQVNADFIEAEDESGEDLTTTELNGNAVGEAQSFFEDGLTLSLVSSSEESNDTNGDTAGGEQGDYTLVFKVTAFGEDSYLPFGATISTSTVDTDDLASYTIEDSNGTALMLNGAGLASTTAVVSSSADISGNYYVVRQGSGNYETFTLQVTLTPAVDGFYRLQLFGVNYNLSTAAAADTLEIAAPANDFETDYENLDV